MLRGGKPVLVFTSKGCAHPSKASLVWGRMMMSKAGDFFCLLAAGWEDTGHQVARVFRGASPGTAQELQTVHVVLPIDSQRTRLRRGLITPIMMCLFL